MRVNAVATLAAVVMAGSAFAGIPIMQIAVSSSSGASGAVVPVGTPSGAPNQYNYTGIVSAAGRVVVVVVTVVVVVAGRVVVVEL